VADRRQFRRDAHELRQVFCIIAERAGGELGENRLVEHLPLDVNKVVAEEEGLRGIAAAVADDAHRPRPHLGECVFRDSARKRDVVEVLGKGQAVQDLLVGDGQPCGGVEVGGIQIIHNVVSLHWWVALRAECKTRRHDSKSEIRKFPRNTSNKFS
jgi:hypothetical protein